MEKKRSNIFIQNSKRIIFDFEARPEDIALCNLRYNALINCIKAKEGFKADKEYRVEEKDGKVKIVLIDQNIGRKKYSSKYIGDM